MKNEDQVKKLVEVSEQIAKFDIEKQSNNFAHGELGFQDAKGDLILIQDFFKELLDSKLEKLPIGPLNTLAATASEVWQQFSAIENFKIRGHSSSQSPEQQRNEIINKLDRLWDKIHVEHSHIWNFLFRDRIDLATQKRRVDSLVNDAESKVSETLDLIEAKKHEIDEAVTIAKETVATAGVSLHTVAYEEAVDDNKGVAFWWLIASITSLIVLLTYLTWSIIEIHNIQKSFQTSSLTMKKEQIEGITSVLYMTIATRAVGAMVIGFVMKSIFGVYRSYLHRVALSEDNQLALSTFKAFHSGAHDPEIKDAVLVGAAGLIFSHRPTGFSEKDSSSQEFGSVIEMAGKLKGK